MFSSYQLQLRLSRWVIYFLLVLLLLVTILPIWLLLVNATRSTSEIQQGISFLPSTHMFENYAILANRGMNMGRGFLNSLFLSVTITLLSVYFGFLAAYGIVVYDFKLKKFFAGLVIVLVLVPLQLSIIGYFQYMSRIGLTDNYLSLILPAIASAFAVFFGIQYLESVVISALIDAARVDGASEIGIFHRIIMPLAIPGAITLAIFTFIASWNNFFTPFILISSRPKYTLPMLVQTLQGDVYRTEYGAIYLGLAITVVPVIIMYIFLSKYIVSGIAMGSVKE
jgi:ABC-type glycerol-3-phosphate transport system permease component